MNVASGCAKANCNAEGELDNFAEGRVARLLPCQCSRRQPRTVAALAAEAKRANSRPVPRKCLPDESETSMASAEVGYDMGKETRGRTSREEKLRRAKLEPCEEKEPEPE